VATCLVVARVVIYPGAGDTTSGTTQMELPAKARLVRDPWAVGTAAGAGDTTSGTTQMELAAKARLVRDPWAVETAAGTPTKLGSKTPTIPIKRNSD
jgi:hypothetical protein